MKYCLCVLMCLPLIVFGKKFAIIDKSWAGELEYAKQELKLFLDNKNDWHYSAGSKDADWIIVLSKRMGMAESAFSIKTAGKQSKLNVELAGRSNSDVFCAAYTLLERLGYTFELNGYQVPDQLKVNTLKNGCDTIVPIAKYRGIRQHINFPMDISSYSIDDAKQYIRNLARMRFNFITFHSYPGQWYEFNGKDTTFLAGNFFYGHRHPVPNDPFFHQHIKNQNVFCIPEIEPYYDSLAIKSKMAVQWLQEVMKEAKRVGLKVQLSFEPRSTSLDVDSTINLIQQIQKQYPLADAFELMTEEAGGWGPANTDVETKQYLASFFGIEILKDTMVTRYIQPKQADLGYLYAQLGHFIKTFNTIKERKIKTKELKIGIYCDGKYNVPVYYLAKKFANGHEIAMLPSHGSDNVAKHTTNLLKERSDWNITQLYSWLEFDGMMFFQQNGIDGIYKLLKYQKDSFPSSRINTVAFNHWRTSENKIAARYAALATMEGPLEPNEFYKTYAKRIGISQADSFAVAMNLIGTAYNFRKSNMAFAWLGYWKNGIRFEDASGLEKQYALYQNAAATLKRCITGKENAYADYTLKFLDNRVDASLKYLKAFLKQNELQNKNLSNAAYETIGEQVIDLFKDCMKTYSMMMPDRGCEGTLINIYHGPIRAVQISIAKKTGKPVGEIQQNSKLFDSPAPPVFQN
ncbi:hypothetical protein [Pinibacter soli]|uniref:Beta-hexosaminidase bacterial type N-terminal domain-containing protein n=1 Tax=Pinibacter soli TaxID=3044211 RepID=A0ABT6RB79_9BACT|nr:hypothetical protein [Pinibacter soli]MDI3319824.1 hypothetical protein [Pinibacter soli]